MAPDRRRRRNRSHPRAARETAPAAAPRNGTPSPPHPRPPPPPSARGHMPLGREPRSPRHPPPQPHLGRAFYPPWHPGSSPTCPVRHSSATHTWARDRCQALRSCRSRRGLSSSCSRWGQCRYYARRGSGHRNARHGPIPPHPPVLRPPPTPAELRPPPTPAVPPVRHGSCRDPSATPSAVTSSCTSWSGQWWWTCA